MHNPKPFFLGGGGGCPFNNHESEQLNFCLTSISLGLPKLKICKVEVLYIFGWVCVFGGVG